MNDRCYQIGLNKEDDVLVDWKSSQRFVVLTPEQAMALADLLIKHAKQSPKWKPQ